MPEPEPVPAGLPTVAGLLAEIDGIGRDPVRGGWTRHVGDAAEGELRSWFAARAAGLGLTVETDRNGTLLAWWGEPGDGAVLTGSHLDSVPGGGALDGPLGVVSGLVAVARMRAAGVVPARPLAVVVFAEEEGSRFGVACLGSRLAVGALDPDRARELRDAAGVSLAEAFERMGIDPAGLGASARIRSASCFVELHVEQGVALAERARPVAVGTGILAHGRWSLEFRGQGNHAGTTRMRGRRDPVVAAAAAVLAIRAIAAQADGDAAAPARATVGRMEIVPGGTNVIASRTLLTLDARAGSDAALAALVERLLAEVAAAADAEGCSVTTAELSLSPFVAFDPLLRDRLSELLDGAPQLPTGAGHDAGVLAAAIPTAMLYVRNPDGISHAPEESASDADAEAGARALERVLRELAG